MSDELSDIHGNRFSNNSFDLWILMSRLNSTINRSCELEVARFGLSPEQAGILDTLLRADGSAGIAEIADATVRQYNSVTTLVNRMIKIGLIKKERTSKNGKYQVSLTPKGRNLVSILPKNAAEMVFSDLSVEEKQKLFDVLSNLLEKSRNLLGMDFIPPFLSS